MARQGNPTGGYTTFWTGELPAYGWSEISYGRDGHSKHVTRPVIVDAEGRQKAIVSIVPQPGGLFTTIVEEVRTPLAKEYKYSSPGRVEIPRDHRGPNRGKWDKPSSQVDDDLQKVEGFITKIRTEFNSQPLRQTDPLSTTNWHGTYTPDFTAHHSTAIFGDNKDHNDNDYSDDDRYKQNNHVTKESTFHKVFRANAASTKPTPITTRPSQGTPLSSATNDVNEALEDFESASKPSSLATTTAAPQARARFTVMVPRILPETIDSEEAKRRSTNFSTSSRPI